jgi:glycogen synthase
MQVLMLSWEYPPRIVGGISRAVHDLAQKLGEDGNQVHVVTCWEENTREMEKDKNVYVHRVHIYDVTANNFIDWVLQLNFAFIEHASRLNNEIGGFDIIHAHDWVVAFAARALKHAYSTPLVSTIHATEYGRNAGIHNDVQKYIAGVEWWLTYESWKVIVNSEYMKNEVQKVFHLPDDKLYVIPNGVDLDKFRGMERDHGFRRNFAGDDEKIVFFVGRLVNEKGVQVLIDAIPKVLTYFHNVKFVIAGKGPSLDYLRSKVSAMNISDKVYFTGYIHDTDLLKLYKCADVAVFPSLYEPFGIVALEGIVANVPIVVSDTGGLGEIVEHGVDGMKSYKGNAESLADSILEILHNPDRAEEMKRRAMEKVHRHYNWKLISDRTVEVYREIIEESRKSPWKAPSIKSTLGL